MPTSAGPISFGCDRSSLNSNLCYVPSCSFYIVKPKLDKCIEHIYKKHFYSKSFKLTGGGGAVSTSSCSTYLDQFANEGLLAADASVRLVTGSNQPRGPAWYHLGPGCLMVWSSVRYPANVRRWPSILDPWQSPWHPTLLLWWCHAPQRTDSNAIWEEFQLSFLAIAPLGALYSLLVLCPEPRPRIGIIFNLHTENVRS